MVISQDARVRSIREGVQALAGVVTILVTVTGAVVWFTGGFRPETQVQMSGLSDQVAQLRSVVNDVGRKVDMLPRASDYAIHDHHLIQLDTAIGALVDRVTHDEIDAKGVAQQVQQLTAGTETRTRNPR